MQDKISQKKNKNKRKFAKASPIDLNQKRSNFYNRSIKTEMVMQKIFVKSQMRF